MKKRALLLAFVCVFIISMGASYASDVSDNVQSVNSKAVEKVSTKTDNSKSSKILASGENSKPTKLSQDNILNASEYLDKYVSKYGKLPNYVTISNYKFSMPEMMYLLAKTVEYKCEKSDSQVTVKYNVKNPTDPSGTNIKGKISLANYYDYTTRVANYIIEHNTAPNYVSTPLGEMQYQQTIYSFVQILGEVKDNKVPKSISLNFKKNSKINNHLPKYTRSSKTLVSNTNDSDDSESGLSGRAGLLELQKYMNKRFNHRSGGSHTAAGVERTGTGDCWGLAEWAAKKLAANGYTVRIVQGASSAASNHRWVQARLDGEWVNFESSLITKKYGSKHYSKTCARVSTIIKYL